MRFALIQPTCRAPSRRLWRICERHLQVGLERRLECLSEWGEMSARGRICRGSELAVERCRTCQRLGLTAFPQVDADLGVCADVFFIVAAKMPDQQLHPAPCRKAARGMAPRRTTTPSMLASRMKTRSSAWCAS